MDSFYPRELRKNMTEAEILLWENLRARKCGGMKFRRQEPIGHCIVDFVCFHPKIVIELDGNHHREKEQKQRDFERDMWLGQEGFKVLRFWNSEVMENMGCVFRKIESFSVPTPPHPSPLPQGEREK